MANCITNHKVNDAYFYLSNLSTSVFIETLCLAGVEMANKDFKKDILIWFAQRDWTLLGMGLEGFDIAEIIWDKLIFEEQKEFINAMIDGVINEKNWNLLCYLPDKEVLFNQINLLKEMISSYELKHIDKESQFILFEFEGNIKKYERCELHKIYKHIEGCVICNNR